MLKAEMHTHTSEDPYDYFVKHSGEDLIEKAAEKGFDVLAITLHDKLYFPKQYKEKAAELDVLLIPGVELNVEGCDVLAYNITKEEAESVEELSDLRELKRDETLIVAPHPYLPFANALMDKTEEYIDVFDALEWSYFYNHVVKYWNRKAKKIANEHGKTLVGNSDVHNLWQLGCTYTKIDAEKDIKSVFDAVKEGRVEVETNPLSFINFMKITYMGVSTKLKRKLNLAPQPNI